MRDGPCKSLRLTVGIENTSDADVNAILAMEAVRQSLGNALALVVAGTRPDRVDMSPAIARSGMEYGNGRVVLTSPRAAGAPQGLRTPLWAYERQLCADVKEQLSLPEVEVIRKRALVRFARPSMFSVPMNDVLIVLTALYW